MPARLPSLFSVKSRIIDPKSSFCDHSGIWLIVAFIRSSFSNCRNLKSAGRSNDDDDVFTLKLLFGWIHECMDKDGQGTLRLDSGQLARLRFIRKWTYLWRLPLFDSHKNTRTSSFFHFGSMLMIQANCSMNNDTTSNGLLLVGSKTFIGHTSMYAMWLLFAIMCLSNRWKWRATQIFFFIRKTSQIIATYSSGVKCLRSPTGRSGNAASLIASNLSVLYFDWSLYE